jgi:hypothetical protein
MNPNFLLKFLVESKIYETGSEFVQDYISDY